MRQYSTIDCGAAARHGGLAMTVLKWLLFGVLALAVLVVMAGQLGWLHGQRPTDLGVRDGRLKPPSRTPNSVSSQARLWPEHPRHDEAQIDPLPMVGDGPSTIARLKAIVHAMPGAAIVTERGDYLHAEFSTRLMHYTDDVEFWIDPAARVVQVRSASRLGRRDFDVNRARVEAIRAQLSAR